MSEAGTGSRGTLGTRVLRGVFWSYGSYIGVRGGSLLATAVLARIITPGDFGLVALAGTFMTFLDMLQGLGVSKALVIVEESEVEAHAETAFAVSTGMGVLLALVTAALGPVAVALFHQPLLYALMPALGLTFLIYGLGATHYALATKRMDFRSRTAAELTDAVARGAVGVGLALAGAGVWSLVGGYIAGNLGMDVVLFRLVRWRPRLRPQRRHLRRLLSFGGTSTLVGIMAAFLAQFDNIVVGRVLGVAALGYYSMATKLPYLFIVSLAMVAGEVLFPAFATLDLQEMRPAFLTSLRYTAMIALPLTATLAILAEPMTIAVFGPYWRASVAAAQVLCLWAVVSPISMVCGNALKSRGRPDIVLWIAIPQAAALIAGSILLARQGIVAISWLQAAIAIVAQITTMVVVQRMFRLSTIAVLRALWPPLCASSGLAVALLVVNGVITAPWPAVITGGLVGAVVYLGLLHLLAPDMLPRLRQLASASRRPEPAPGHEFESALASGEPDSVARPATTPATEIVR